MYNTVKCSYPDCVNEIQFSISGPGHSANEALLPHNEIRDLTDKGNI